MTDYLADLERSLRVAAAREYRVSPEPSLAPRGGSLVWPAAGRRRLLASAGAVAVVACLVALLVAFSAGSSPSPAEAFPILSKPVRPTPPALQSALRIYGVSPGEVAGLDIRHGRPFSTPWGTGYVLTNGSVGFICAVAPGSRELSWGAACARTALARREGTSIEFSYDKTAGTARYLALLPAGATATAQAPGEQPRPLPLRNEILVLVVHHPIQITIHMHGRVTIERLFLRGPSATPAPAGPGAGSQSTTTAAATSTKR